jgi:hypothetical protein
MSAVPFFGVMANQNRLAGWDHLELFPRGKVPPGRNAFVFLGQFAKAFGFLLPLEFEIVHKLRTDLVGVAGHGIRSGKSRGLRGTARGVAKTHRLRGHARVVEVRHARSRPGPGHFPLTNQERRFQNKTARRGCHCYRRKRRCKRRRLPMVCRVFPATRTTT